MVKRSVGTVKRLSAVFLTLCMLTAAVPAGATGTEYIPTGNELDSPGETVDTTPAADKFTIDGRGFVLLDTFDNDESAYYVTTTDAYGDMETISDGTEGGFENPAGKQIDYDAYKSDAFLNGDFLTKGNNFTSLGNDTTTYYKLPQGIIDNIDNNHVWKRFVNDYRSGTGVKGEYTTGVSLLSWTDFTTYAGKLGAVDGFLNSNASNADVYFLRDTNNWGGDSALAMFCTADKKCKHWGQYVRKYGFLRPAFYLKKDFFKTTKINLATMGKNVKEAIRTACTDDELIELYGVRDCKTYFGMDIDIAYIELSLRNGKDIGDANILDTVIATAENAVVDEFCWEISDDDGSNWYKAEDETGNSIILTAEYAGKLLRCRAESDGEEISSAILKVPNPEIAQTQSANLDGFMEETPDKYRFTIDGRGFVLLDTFDNDKSTYYVTTTEAYGDMQTLAVESGDFEVPTGKQINYDAYKSDAFLNGSFLTNGNNFSVLSDDTKTYYKLPQGIIDHINKDHVWWRFANAAMQSEKGVLPTYKTGVSLLSWTDFMTYAGKLGVTEVFDDANVKFDNIEKAYYLRDTNNWGGDSALAVLCAGSNAVGCTFVGVGAQKAGLLRPAFYLDKDFFKTVKIDLSQTGETILDMMRESYCVEDLTELYSEEELTEKGFLHRYSMRASYTQCNDSKELTSLAGVSSLQANVTIRNRSNSETNALLLLAVYKENGNMIGIAKKEVRLEAQSDTESSVAIESLPEGVTDKYKVSVMLWDNVHEMYSFTGNKLTFDNKGR
ncbi:MAG: hypothetical protein PUF72_03525 [Clostridiales bacterium]|nr:hypothetical protein [Clostridiales bacterium]